ncbi:MAG: ribose 5-phosphate isomerase A [Burkholderiales bacterium]|jgi:ribose 5-phosphate isomerase A|nr:MAG: ribose 5-phosphate isomerase A [Burkholderiales bacterium]
MHSSELKRAAARAALDDLVVGAVLGVGSGSTVDLFVDELAALASPPPALVCASQRTAARARSRGLRVLDLNEVLAGGASIPVYVDGADEIDPQLRMIKGGGAALTREKIVASASGHFVCIVDASKCVRRLGAFPLPVEVIPMARELVAQRLRALGGEPSLRESGLTDNGNEILDVRGLDLADPERVEACIEQWPGVVAAGLFAVHGADVAIIAAPDGIERRKATGARG